MAKTIDINALKEFKKKCDETYTKIGQGGGSSSGGTYLYRIDKINGTIKGEQLSFTLTISAPKQSLDLFASTFLGGGTFEDFMGAYSEVSSEFENYIGYLLQYGAYLIVGCDKGLFTLSNINLTNTYEPQVLLNKEIVGIEWVGGFANTTPQKLI